MVKREVDIISLKEWLEEGVASSEANHANAAAAKEKRAMSYFSTVAGVHPGVKAKPVAVVPADVAEPKDEGSNWFWLLLE